MTWWDPRTWGRTREMRFREASAADQGRIDFGQEEFHLDGTSTNRWGGRAAGTDDIDASPKERESARKASRRLYRRCGIYGHLCDLVASWVVADGVVIQAEDEGADKFLQEVLEAPENDFHRRLRQRVRNTFIDGEYLLPMVVPTRMPASSPGELATPTSKVRMGRMLPEHMTGYKADVVDVERVRALLMKRPGENEEREYPIAEVGQQPKEIHDAQIAIAYWRVNVIQVRGLPLFSRILDKAAMLDEVVEHIARKAEYTNRFWLFLKYKPSGDSKKDDAFEKKMLEWAKKAQRGEIGVTGEDVTFEILAPELAIMDVKALYDLLVDWILGSSGGVPRMFFSSGGDTNRATAVEQGTPFARQIQALQADIRAWLEDLCRYLIYLGKLSGAVAKTASDKVAVTMPTVASRDAERDVRELAGISAVTEDLVRKKSISPEEGQAIDRATLASKWYGDFMEEDAPELPEEPDPALDPAQGPSASDKAPPQDDGSKDPTPPPKQRVAESRRVRRMLVGIPDTPATRRFLASLPGHRRGWRGAPAAAGK